MTTTPLHVSFGKKIAPAAVAGFVLLVIALLLSGLSVQEVRSTSDRTHQSEELRVSLEALRGALLDMETGQRGFLLTASNDYLQAFWTGTASYEQLFPRIEKAVADNPIQVENLARLRSLIDVRLGQIQHNIENRRSQGLEAAIAYLLTNQGHTTMEEIRQVLRHMSLEEERQLQLRKTQEARSLTRNLFLIVSLCVLTALLVFAVYLRVQREMAARTNAARKLDELNASLESRIAAATRELSERNAALTAEIEQRRHAERELQESRDLLETRVKERTRELEEATASKSRFLSAASHDLRQPLHSMTLLNAALRGQKLAEPIREIVNAQQVSLDAMGSLVHALLNISMLESGAVQPQIQDFPLAGVLSPLQVEFAPQAQAKSLQLWVEPSTKVVRSDPTLLREIVQNLIGNAVRYTDRGAVSVSVSSADDLVWIEVKDTGRGIPADQLGLIFEEFHQIRANGERPRGGFGLGLSIVRRLAKLLDIKLSVQSTVGDGTTFSVQVRAGTERASAAEKVATQSPTEARTADILLIDDEEGVRTATALFLQLDGHRVRDASSPDEAFAAAAAMGDRLDVIVSDFQLGTELTGADVIERIRARAEREIPAIVLSGDMLQAGRRCSLLESCRIFHKPVDAEELAAHVQRLLARAVRAQDERIAQGTSG